LRFGLEARQWLLIENILVKPLKEKGVKIWVFGSRVTGTHQKFSDIDVLLEGHIPALILSEIKERLEESSLPIKVDIVELRDLAESYRAQILSERVAV
jgi:uncharacterized protein